MSSYLQRLLDRSAGAALVPAPALRPGSPLTAYDQRLGIAELAQDFSFGNLPEAPSIEIGNPDVPVPAEPPSKSRPVHDTPAPKPRDESLPAESGRHRVVETPASRSGEAKPKPAPRIAPSSDTEPVSDGPPTVSPAPRKTAPGPRHEPEVRGDRPRASPKPPPSPPAATAPDETPTEVRRSRNASVQGALPPGPRVTTAQPVERQPRSAASKDKPERAKSFEPRQLLRTEAGPLAKAQPLERAAPEPLAAEAAPMDWSEVDRRIERALKSIAKPTIEQRPTPAAAVVAPDEQSEDGRSKPKQFISAAAASVIGPIESSPRFHMLLGTRWR